MRGLPSAALADGLVRMQGPFIACNVRLSPPSLARMVHSVGTALHKWALRHDQVLPGSP